MSSVHGIYGMIHQSSEMHNFSRRDDIKKGRDDLTYFEHYSPCCPGTFSHVDSAQVCRMRDDGEDFTFQSDWGAMFISGFEGFAADFCQ